MHTECKETWEKTLLANKPCSQANCVGSKEKKREEAINQTFRHHNSAWVISLIKSVWVFPATSSLLNMGQTGIDFTENEFSSARHINYLSSQLKLKWMVEAQTGKTQLDCLHTQRERRKLDPSWNDASRKRQDVIQLLSGNSNSPIFRVLICKLICGWQRQAWVWKRILDVIWCLSTSSLGDWSLIGNEGTAFSLWGSQGGDGTHTNCKTLFHTTEVKLVIQRWLADKCLPCLWNKKI